MSLTIATELCDRGWAVIPVPPRSKNPGRPGWQDLRLEREDLPDHFSDDRPSNVGVLLGEASGGLVDIDLDHPLAVELAPEYLPPTDACFGRQSRRRSHWLYRVPGDAPPPQQWRRSGQVLMELRSTGQQTLFPGSVHPSGEPITWDSVGEPASAAAGTLVSALDSLAAAVRARLDRPSSEAPADDRSARCLAAMTRMQIIDTQDGSHRLYCCACRVVEHDLDDETALAVLRRYAEQHPFPTTWRDDQIVARIRSAEQRCERGRALLAAVQGHDHLGHRDEQGRLVLSTARTLPTARAFVAEHYSRPEGATLRHQAGEYLAWDGRCYLPVEEGMLYRQMYTWLDRAYRDDRSRYAVRDLQPFPANAGTVRSALEAVRNHVFLAATVPSPSWLDGGPPMSPDGMPYGAHEIVACRSTLLHLPSMALLPPTPRYFGRAALDVDWDPEAQCPRWLRFMGDLFHDDRASQRLLRDWFGYCLAADTSQHRILLIVGPPRSGKSTIARVLRQMVGIANTTGPTASSLASDFGLQPLLGKSLAVVSDARFAGRERTVLERLLCVSGEDGLSISRKHLTNVETTLNTRIVLISNELPRLQDASRAFAGRLLTLRLSRSFCGAENPHLTRELIEELPGIVRWAVRGWQALHSRGRFLLPRSGVEAQREIEDLSSPVTAFVRDRCRVGTGLRVSLDDLYRAWQRWCQEDGREHHTTRQTFGRDLRAALPGLTVRRGTSDERRYEGIALRAAVGRVRHIPA